MLLYFKVLTIRLSYNCAKNINNLPPKLHSKIPKETNKITHSESIIFIPSVFIIFCIFVNFGFRDNELASLLSFLASGSILIILVILSFFGIAKLIIIVRIQLNFLMFSWRFRRPFGRWWPRSIRTTERSEKSYWTLNDHKKKIWVTGIGRGDS